MGQYEELKHNTEKIETAAPLGAKRLLEEMKDIEQSLVVEKKNPTLPEFVFKEYFLEFFRSYHKLTKHDKDNAPLYAKWLELAGSEYGEVDIVDNEGNVLYTTPGLLARPKINFDHTAATKIDKLADDAINKYNRTPTESANSIINKINKTMPNLIEEASTYEAAKWDSILKKYKTDEDKAKREVVFKKRRISKVVKEDLGLIYD